MKNYHLITYSSLFIFFLFIFHSCDKDRPIVETQPVAESDVTITTAIVRGDVTDNGGAVVTERGICYGTTVNPTVREEASKGGMGDFEVTLTGLSPDTKYFARAYAENGEGTSYGDNEEFTTEKEIIPPEVHTESIDDITITSAVVQGNVVSDGGAAVTSRGICYGTSPSPTEKVPDDEAGNGIFKVTLSGLESGRDYYARAYATNSAGTDYGDDLPFRTGCNAPSATTDAASDEGTTTATLNGTVNANNSATTVTFEYGTSTSYGSTITAIPSPVTGSNNTSVTANLTGLEPNTTYYYRVSAESCGGTIIGDDQTFQTLCLAPSATIGGYASSYESTQIGGTVNANNSSTTVIFEYGTTTNFGSTITAAQSPITGSSDTYVSALLTGLAPDTRYYYRIRASNCGGTTYSDNFDFTSPLCPESITRTHTAGSVAPVTMTVNYAVINTNLSGENKCWITKNLGASNQASSVTDDTEAASGWYWQFNRRQGYKHDGTIRTPNTTWISSIIEWSNWTAANDPCTILLGSGWRIPTRTEWENVIENGAWDNYFAAFSSDLKIHNAFQLYYEDGNRFGGGTYWSSSQYEGAATSSIGWAFIMTDVACVVLPSWQYKSYGKPLRCLKD